MLIAGLLIVLFVLGGCASKREYNDDISIPLEEDKSEIIREWSYLLGSGAEIYYFDGDKEVLLGNLLGGDDGFCPFKEGQYYVTAEDNKLTIEWCRIPNIARKSWDKKVFELPAD